MKTQKVKSTGRKEIISFLIKLSSKFKVPSKRKLQPVAIAENDWLWHYSY
jgi:hypothetical protein